ncbi:MAG: hypothetical protein ACOX2U_02095 [Limisphaerales bacterium]|jgi:hypothetical protein
MDAQLAVLSQELDAANAVLNAAADARLEPPLLEPIQLVDRLYMVGELSPFERLREACFCFQGLTDAGTNSIPAITKYFESGADEKLLAQRYFSLPQTPPSVRMGLLSVLRDVGGMESVALLSRIMPVAKDATELKTLVDGLMEADPDFYRPFCIQIARRTYEDYLEKQQEGIVAKSLELRIYWGTLLGTLKDRETAQKMVDERAYIHYRSVDRECFAQLTSALGEDIIPAMRDILDNPDLTRYAKISVLFNPDPVSVEGLEDFAGRNPQASEIFIAAMKETDSPAFRALRTTMLSVQVGTQSPNPELIQNRLHLLNQIEQQFGKDQYMDSVIPATRAMLEYQANPSAYTEPPKVYTFTGMESVQKLMEEYSAFEQQLIEENNREMTR